MAHCIRVRHPTSVDAGFPRTRDGVVRKYPKKLETNFLEDMSLLNISSQEEEVPGQKTNRVVDRNNETTLLENMSMLDISEEDRNLQS
ncbi:hypothetical protein DCAR_0933894 [Daucus carota subsp. sativus]|uniref:Uncharacterized protein n=1 Tax=Daucus carota subsp. sativus TaxID=79200 RepID=A0A175YE86_DAUCS|nr:hypothetical protein DCAR_0933894 [Daucus carota subsp. sativus]